MNYRHIQKIFIANRGEIALRIIHTAKKMGISTVIPVIREELINAPALEADEVIVLDHSSLVESYLNGELMIHLALKHDADAIHPGYGFLSENSAFASQIEKSGLIWIGPSPSTISVMGNKLEARQIARTANIPITRSIEGTNAEIIENQNELNYPLLIKAASGGGGKGMKIAKNPAELENALLSASREAISYFGDDTVYVEEYINDPHHIEVQVLGDQQGNIVHLYERECSIQRRHQKIIEEAPSPFVTEQIRKKLTADALKLCRQIGYYNAGTVEFLVDATGYHYFLEMNTRLQVEHPVTEAITGLDLVEQQIKTAMGLPLSVSQEHISIKGHAIEGRVYAEDALNDFSPAPGEIEFVHWPNEKTARSDTFFNTKTVIQPNFDPMLAKIIAHGETRESATRKLAQGLAQTSILGVTTNLPYLSQLLKTKAFIKGVTTTHFTTLHQQQIEQAIYPNGTEKTHLLLAGYTIWLANFRTHRTNNLWAKMGHKRWNGDHFVKFNNHLYYIKRTFHQTPGSIKWLTDHMDMPEITEIQFSENQLSFHFKAQFHKLTWYHRSDGKLLIGAEGHTYFLQPGYHLNNQPPIISRKNEGINNIKAPIPGKIIKIYGKQGEKVEIGSPLLILEAMKMENTIKASASGIIKTLRIKEFEQVKAGQLLAEIENSLIIGE